MKKYEYKVGHNADGYWHYDKYTFIRELPHLERTLSILNKANITPRVGDEIYGYDEIYHIRLITFYQWGCIFWVDEDKNRNRDD